MSLRKIKLISSKKGYEVNICKTVVTNVLGSDGKIEKIPNVLIDKDPRGNWIFVDTGKGYSEFILSETDEWLNTTPTVVSEEIARRSPGIDKRYGPNVPYVSLEEALIAFYKDCKSLITAREFAIVYEKGLEDVIKCIVENGWPTDRIENYQEYLFNTQPKTNETVEPLEAKEQSASSSGRPRTARQAVRELSASSQG